MKNELISMVDFVKFINSLTTTELIKEFPNHFTEYRPSLHKDMVRYLLSIDAIKWKITKEFMQFLNTPLNISMFVPAIEVDGKWEVLEWKEPYQEGNVGNNRQYQQAKDRVIFEDKEIVANIWEFYKGKTIQSLIKHNYTLTAKGQELSGLNK